MRRNKLVKNILIKIKDLLLQPEPFPEYAKIEQNNFEIFKKEVIACFTLALQEYFFADIKSNKDNVTVRFNDKEKYIIRIYCDEQQD